MATPPQASSRAPHAALTATTTPLAETPRTTLKRRRQRGSHDRAALHAIFDEALVCHVGAVIDGAPRVLPTAHVRVGEALYVHGSRGNRLMAAMIGREVAITATLLDGLVMSRTAFHHSMNYRSAVVYGEGAEVTCADEKRLALHALVEHIAPGRGAEVRAPVAGELEATLVVRVPIEEGSVKARTGPAMDDAETLGDDCWAGVIPLELRARAPERDAELPSERLISDAVSRRARALGAGTRVPYERRAGELVVSTDPARLDFARVHAFLRDESYWAHGVSEDALRTSLANALCFGLYRGRTQLGFARVVTDGARIAYVGDVLVLAPERGRGYGKLLVESVLAHPELQRVERVLLGTRDAHGLYERYGFVRAEPGKYLVLRR